MTTDFSVEPISEGALLLRFGDSIDATTNKRVHAAAHALGAAVLPGVTDIAPAYTSLLVRFDPHAWTTNGASAPQQRVREILDGMTPKKPDPGLRRDDDEANMPSSRDATVVEVPVCYAGDFCPDLEAVAAHAGLTPDAVITRHSEAGYTVAMLGFAPGFPYLLGLDPALHMPRRATPRTRVPAGSVAIGGAQTGIYPRELPGGWNLIGRTPLMLFDAHRDPPALLAPGDRVRFRAIDANEFTLLREKYGPPDQGKLREQSGQGRPFLIHAIRDDRKNMPIEIIKPGLLTTLQDAGRPGYAHLGVGRAGAFDVPALRIANALCGNPRGTCGLEITLLGPTLRFHSDAQIAVTGAPLSLSVNGEDAPMWAPVPIHAGATVTLGAIRHGCRSYLAVNGGFAADPVLGSRSTDVNAGVGPLDGRPLRAGDALTVGEMGSGSFFNGNSQIRDNAKKNEPDPSSLNWRLDPRPWFLRADASPLRLLPGSQFDALTEKSRRVLFSETFLVTTKSNRTGVRLTGPKLGFTSPISMLSEGCVPGLLQLPPSGQPIAFGVECPVTGGYPRIGQVAAVDLPRLAQCRPGDALRFQPCTLDEALDALRDRERALTRLEAIISARLAA